MQLFLLEPEVIEILTSYFKFSTSHISVSFTPIFVRLLSCISQFKYLSKGLLYIGCPITFQSGILKLNMNERICLQKHVLFDELAPSQNGFNDCEITLYGQMRFGR